MSVIKTGYPGLSELMAHDSGMGMFKRFASPNMRNLLYMQAELLDLEDELENICLDDHNHATRGPYEFNATDLRRSATSSDSEERRQYEKILEIRGKLKEYSTH